MMEAVHGIFDGKNIVMTDQIMTKKKFKVVITFLEEIDEAEEHTEDESRNFAAQTDGLSFWQDEQEDVYQDYLKKD